MRIVMPIMCARVVNVQEGFVFASRCCTAGGRRMRPGCDELNRKSLNEIRIQ